MSRWWPLHEEIDDAVSLGNEASGTYSPQPLAQALVGGASGLHGRGDVKNGYMRGCIAKQGGVRKERGKRLDPGLDRRCQDLRRTQMSDLESSAGACGQTHAQPRGSQALCLHGHLYISFFFDLPRNIDRPFPVIIDGANVSASPFRST